MKKFLLILISSLLLLAVLFFFWASASKLDESTYTQISTYDSLENDYAPGDTLSILTYNIGYLSGMTNNLAADTDEAFYTNNLNQALALFKELNPMIAGFQEIDFASSRSYDIHQLDAIGNANEYHNGALTVNWDKNYLPFPYWPISAQYGEMLSGQALLSDFKITTNERVVMEKPESNPAYYNAFYIDRLAQVVTINIGNQEIIVINTHLEAWDIPAREKQAKIVLELYEKYNATHPVILLGDFNSIPPFDPTSNEYYSQDKTMDIIFSGTNIQSAISKSDYLQNRNKHFTFSSADPTIMIDYIFYNDRISPVTSRVVNEAGDISDHLPVYFEFVLND